MSVCVLGSVNLDQVLHVDHPPQQGETVLGRSGLRGLGGKGFNQAVAAARAGSATCFIGAVGDDDAGHQAHAALAEEMINDQLSTIDQPTGTAVVLVDASADNAIVVASGANAHLPELSETQSAKLRNTKVLLVQLEVPEARVQTACALARQSGAFVILNAAPADPVTLGLLEVTDLLVVNEDEAWHLVTQFGAYSAAPARTPATAADHLTGLVPWVIVTAGKNGCVLASSQGETLSIPGRTVHVVDTTAAGDTFCGVIASSIEQASAVTVLADLLGPARHATTAASLLSS